MLRKIITNIFCLLIYIPLSATNNISPNDENSFLIDSLNSEAQIQWKNDRRDFALNIFQNVLDKQQQMDDKSGMLKTCYKIGFLHLHNSNLSGAYSYFNNAFEISKLNPFNKISIYIQMNLAYVSLQMDEMGKTVIYLNDVLSKINATGDSCLIKRAYGITALYYEKNDDIDKALNYYSNYESINQAINNRNRVSLWRDNMNDIIIDTETNLLDDKIKFALNNLQLKEKDNRILQVQKAKNILITGIIINAIILLILIYVLFERIKDNKKLNIQNQEIEQQKEKLSLQNKNITSSITYAQTIQNASLPDLKKMSKFIDCGIFYRPKDIVSGDFYWYHNFDDKSCLIAVVDSTGHGVPGAFMSMIGIQLLNEIVIANNITTPSEILSQLNKKLYKALKQDTSENEDGMDVCLCKLESISEQNCKITFAGAKRPLFHYSSQSNKLNIITSSSNSTGGRYAKKSNVEYLQEEIFTTRGDLLVLTTDGIIDQPSAGLKKFGSIHLLETLSNNVSLNVGEQIKKLINEFETHIGNAPQRDDVTVLLIKLL